MEVYVLLGIFLLLALVVPHLRKRQPIAWPIQPRPLDADVLEDIRTYYDSRQRHQPDLYAVDEITWRDLDMDKVFGRLNATLSNVGEERLYAMLREAGAPDEVLKRRGELIRAIAKDESVRKAVMPVIARLGKDHFYGTSVYLFEAAYKQPKHFPLYLLSAIAPVLCLILIFVTPAALYAFMAALLVNIVVYYNTAKKWDAEIRALRRLAGVIQCALKLSALDVPTLKPELDELRSLSGALRSIRNWCQGFVETRHENPLDFVGEYMKILFQVNMICLCRITASVIRNADALEKLYAKLGELDALIAISSVSVDAERFAEPEFVDERCVRCSELVHPLLHTPVPNSINWTKNLLITGSNASGKSTFTKAMAVNAILAQTIYRTFSASFSMPRARVITSMAIQDSIQNGESYFIAEIKSLRRVLDAMEDERVTLCFIDEILRGTNTIERIAASDALLRHISQKNALLMAATHDIELTERLKDRYENHHFREIIVEGGMQFPYKLMPGPSQSRNAIALLRIMGFPDKVVEDAESAAAGMDARGRIPGEITERAEMWDVYDRQGEKTGKTTFPGQQMGEGEVHLGASLWIINSRGQALIQKRAANKRVNPGKWSITGGSVHSGETSRQGCVREAREEIGLSIAEHEVEFLSSSLEADNLFDDYIVFLDFDLDDAQIQPEEVDEIRWASFDEILSMFHAGQFMFSDVREIEKAQAFVDSRMSIK